MPRRVFPAGTVTNTTGAPLRLEFYPTSTSIRREADLWTVDGSNNLVERIANGIVLTNAVGAYSAFAGPDDLDTLYALPNNTTSRTTLTATASVTGAPASSSLGGVTVSGTASNGKVLTATSSSAATWSTPTISSVVGQTGAVTGTQIAADAALTATFAKVASNLSDLTSTSTARTSLGLGASAVMSTAQIAADSALTAVYAQPGGAWLAGTYSINQVVTYNGSTYRSKVGGNTATPGTDATKWESWGGSRPSLTPAAITSTSTTPTSADDFATGSVLSGRSTSTGALAWTERTGTWNITSQQATPSATTDGLIATFPGGLPQCTISCDVISTGTTSTNKINAGLVFRYTDSSNYFYYQADAGIGYLQLFRVTTGTHNLLAESALAGMSGVTTTLRVDLCGPDITLWVNGTELLSMAEQQGMSATAIGFRQGAGSTKPTTAKFDNVQVLPFQGTRFNWPNIPVRSATQIIDVGSAGTWDSTDVNNPVPVWDPVNNRYALYYSGYYNGGTLGANTGTTTAGAGDNGIQQMGIAYATSPGGTWTKEAGNPVYADDAAGRDNMDGSMVYFNGEWIHVYVAGTNTKVALARAPALTGTWVKQGDILTASGTEGACVDPFLRVRQDGVTLELWYATNNASPRKINYATSIDGGLTWTKQGGGSSPVFTAPAFQNPTFMTQAGVYVPPGKEGVEMLCVFDTATQANSPFTNTSNTRRICAALTVDGGVTWHWRLFAREVGSGSGFMAGQVFDPYILVDGNTFYLFHSATQATNVTELNGPIRIGVRSAAWNSQTLVVTSPN